MLLEMILRNKLDRVKAIVVTSLMQLSFIVIILQAWRKTSRHVPQFFCFNVRILFHEEKSELFCHTSTFKKKDKGPPPQTKVIMHNIFCPLGSEAGWTVVGFEILQHKQWRLVLRRKTKRSCHFRQLKMSASTEYISHRYKQSCSGKKFWKRLGVKGFIILEHVANLPGLVWAFGTRKL